MNPAAVRLPDEPEYEHDQPYADERRGLPGAARVPPGSRHALKPPGKRNMSGQRTPLTGFHS
ncbi:hypothetical protein CU044_1763 [Streptomyces sp. L-9-10]|nr:hypothetical protein CU044_1763 [Streptomyces sp. L-9-10]